MDVEAIAAHYRTTTISTNHRFNQPHPSRACRLVHVNPKIPCPQITAPPCASWDGQDVRVEVVFEPECTGEVEDTLVLSSTNHGSYRCKLKGLCSPPLPQVRGGIGNGLRKGTAPDLAVLVWFEMRAMTRGIKGIPFLGESIFRMTDRLNPKNHVEKSFKFRKIIHIFCQVTLTKAAACG